MGWPEIISLLITFGPKGVDLAETIWKKWAAKTPPGPQDFADLRALLQQSATDKMKAQLTAAGIALDSPQAIALLALTA